MKRTGVALLFMSVLVCRNGDCKQSTAPCSLFLARNPLPACPSLAAACAVIAPRDSYPTPPWAMRLAWMKDMTAKCNFKSFTHANRYSCDTPWLIMSTNMYFHCIYIYINMSHRFPMFFSALVDPIPWRVR